MVSGEPMRPPACIFSPAGDRRNDWYSSHRFTSPVPGTWVA
jgi:hypothetical protein